MLSLCRSLTQCVQSCFSAEKILATTANCCFNGKWNSIASNSQATFHHSANSLHLLRDKDQILQPLHGLYSDYRRKFASLAFASVVDKQKFLNKSFQGSKCTLIPLRNVIMIGYDGKKHNDEEAVNRFRRLGNGLWLRKQVGYDKNLWKKFYKRRKPWKVFRLQRAVFCNYWQSKMLDKMVTDEFKEQKWYVDDLYKGYTEESLMYYHPKDLPWNSLKLSGDHFKYAVKRNKRGNLKRIHRRTMHRRVVDSYRQKPLPNTKTGFSFA